jgi:solute carrier family 25 protein 38
MPGPRQHKNIFSATNSLYKNEGFKVFWKGTTPTCIKDGLFAGIYYQLYQATKNNYLGYEAIDNFIAGLFAGGFATVISHPFEILRAKIQSGDSSIASKLTCGLKQIYQEDGALGFLKGVGPRLARKPLINATTFMVF